MNMRKILSIFMSVTLMWCSIAMSNTDIIHALNYNKETNTVEGECTTFNPETGVLILHGNVTRKEVAQYGNIDDKGTYKVKSITAAEGTVLPESCKSLFHGFDYLESIDLNKADTSNVTDMSSMFAFNRKLESINISSFNTSKVTNMSCMFHTCPLLKKIDVSSFDTSKVVDMNEMFFYCKSLTTLDLSSFDTSKVQGMLGMFEYCSNLQVLNIANFNTSNVLGMQCMFAGCNFSYITLNNFDTSKVISMEGMFGDCKNLQKLIIPNFDVSNVIEMNAMFSGCKKIKEIDISGFLLSDDLLTMENMFLGCENLETIKVNNKWTTKNVKKLEGRRMFFGCTSLVGQYGTKYDSSYTGLEYAKIDEPDRPGYFTAKKPYTPSTTTESTTTPKNITTTTVNSSNVSTLSTTSTTVISTHTSKTTTPNPQSGEKKTPIIVIPGIMGTELYEGQTRVWTPKQDWANFSESIKNDNILSYHNRYSIQNNLDERVYGVMNHMKNMIDTLCDKFPNRDIYVFSYDWRKSNTQTAAELKNFINSLEVDKVDIVAHSMGGLVTSEYFANATKNGDNKVNKIITLGTPYEGSPHVFEALEQNKVTGDNISAKFANAMLSFLGLSRKIKFEFAGVKELIPTQKYNNMIPIMKREPIEGSLINYNDHKMNDDEYIDMLNTEFGSESASQTLNFHKSMLDESNYNVLSNYNNAYFILGQNQKTVKTVYMSYDEMRDGDMVNGYIPGYYIDAVKYTKSGDGTVPYTSASMCGRTLSLNNDHQFTIDSGHMELMNNKEAIDIVCKILNNEKADPHPYFTPDPYAEYDIECPVDVEIGSGDDRLCSVSDSISLVSSFGRLDIVGKNNDKKMLCIDEDTNLDINLTGTDTGTMDFTVRHFSGEDELLDERIFENVPLTNKTIIKTKADNNEVTVLNVDIDGDGVVDETWTAKKNETVKAADEKINITTTVSVTTTSSSTKTTFSTQTTKSSITTTTITTTQKSETILGDVNNDGQINAVDASSVLAYYARISTNQEGGYNEEQMLAADVNHDGMINAVDASNILAYYAYASTTKEDILSIDEYMKKKYFTN